jgi:hypothetical protein
MYNNTDSIILCILAHILRVLCIINVNVYEIALTSFEFPTYILSSKYNITTTIKFLIPNKLGLTRNETQFKSIELRGFKY